METQIINASDMINTDTENTNQQSASIVENEDEEKILCTICQEYIDMEAEIYKPTSYKLETCTHRFHTTCIINWFRQGNKTCPNCGDNGPHSGGSGAFRYWARGVRAYELQARFSLLRTYSKTKNAPQFLVKKFEKLKSLEEKEKKAKMEKKEGKKRKCDPEKTYSELQKDQMKLSRKAWSAERRVVEEKRKIAVIPIVPVIIPKIKYIVKEVSNQNEIIE